MSLIAQFTFTRVLGLMILAAGLVWALVLVPEWRRRAERRGGKWYLEAVLLVNGIGAALSTTLLAESVFTTLLFWAGVGLSGFVLAQALRTPRLAAGVLIGAVVAFYLALFVSSLFGFLPSYSRYYWATPLIVVAFVAHGGYTLSWLTIQARFNLRILIVGSLVVAVAIPGMAFSSTGSLRTFLGIPRLQGIIAHPNGLAAVAVLLVLFELARRPKGISRIWVLFPLIVMFLAQSTTAWVSLLLIGLPLLTSALGRWARRVLFSATILLSITMFFSPTAINEWLNSILPRDWQSLTGRTEIWDAALHGFRLNNWFGYGPNLLDEAYRARWIPGLDAAGQAHNQFIQSMGGEGYLGLGSLVVLVVILAYYALRYSDVSNGLALAVTGVYICRMMTETPLRPGGVNIFTFFTMITLGLVAASISEAKAKAVKSKIRDSAVREKADTTV